MFVQLSSEIANNPTLSPKIGRESRSDRVALVCMPWGAVSTPSLAVAVLKRCVKAAGFTPHLHYCNIRLAERLGLEKYEKIARASFCQTEWFFSQSLFGRDGTGEIRNGWEDLVKTDCGKNLVRYLREDVGIPEEDCRRVAEVEIPAFIDDCFNETDWGQYLAVGFTTTFSQSLASLLLSKRIKQKFPHVAIIFGGANVDSEMGVEFVKAFEWVDYVIHGEAELTFPALLEKLTSGETSAGSPGVTTRNEKGVQRGDAGQQPVIDLNSIPAPDYSDYVAALDRAQFRKKMPLSLYFESSRGCWWGAKHHCTFCGLNGTTMAFRRKDADRVYAELVELSNKYKCLQFCATDNILANDYFKDLLPKLAELGSDIRIFYEIKANLRKDQLAMIRAAGINQVQPGIESFSSRILQLMNKGATAIQNIQLLKWCFELDIDPGYNFLYGFPQEVSQDYAHLPELCQMISHLRPPNTTCAIIFERFSPYYFDRERFKLSIQPWEEYGLIYPESRVDLSRIAYFFRGKWDGQQADPEEYTAPVKTAIERWRETWKNGAVFCWYERGPNYLRIWDNRLRIKDAQLSVRGLCLRDHLAALYLYCDENRSFRAVVKFMRERFGESITEKQVQDWLDQLVFQWLMFREGDRYLSLAVRRPSASSIPKPAN
jgi:ribosomal peptide maturation radical SAM protein 1